MRQKRHIRVSAIVNGLMLLLALLSASPSESAGQVEPTASAPMTDRTLGESSAAKLQFELLHQASKDNFRAWSGNVWGTVGFLIVVIGWLLTAKGARIFLSRQQEARRVALAAVGVIAAINIGLNLVLAYRSNELQQLLAKNKYVQQQQLEPVHYGNYQVALYNAILSDVLVGSMFILIAYLLLAMRTWEEPEKD